MNSRDTLLLASAGALSHLVGAAVRFALGAVLGAAAVANGHRYFPLRGVSGSASSPGLRGGSCAIQLFVVFRLLLL